MISANIAKNVLLLTAETYSKHIHPKDKGNRTIFGDAAAATLISTNGFAIIGDFCLGTDGGGAENLIVKRGGLRNPNAMHDTEFDEAGNLSSSDYLYMNGAEIFNFTSEAVPKLVEKVLEKNKISNESPVGHALLGKKVGSLIKVDTPDGCIKYQILDIHR